MQALTTLLCTLSCWKRHATEPFQLGSQILGHPKLLEQISPSERAQRLITVKLFLLDPHAKDTVRAAIEQACQALGIASVDVVLLAAPALLSASREVPSEFAAHWKDLEASQRAGTVTQIGASDVTYEQLQALLRDSEVKPSVIQVPIDPLLHTPCKIKALYDLATQHGVRVGTHNDVQDMLPRERFSEAISAHVAEGQWRPTWLARYSVLDPARSVITNRGYLIAGVRA